MAGQYITVAVHHTLHHIGCVQIAAVDARCLRGNESHRGGIEVLAEGVAGQIQLRGRFLRGKNTRGLAVEINAAAIHQTEVFHIAVELLRAQPQSVGDKGGVAGVARRFLQRLMSVTSPAAAVDGSVQHMDIPIAAEGGVFVNGSLLQRRREGQHLEGRARLIGVVDGLVAPLAKLCGRQIQPAVLYQFRRGSIINGRWIVEVIGRVRGHG